MVSLSVDIHGPEAERRTLGPEELEAVFRALDLATQATFTCDDEENDRSLIVGVDGDLAYPEFLYDGTFYRIESSADEGTEEIALGGHWPEEYPRRNLLPRDAALDLLRQAVEDMDALFARYTWVV